MKVEDLKLYNKYKDINNPDIEFIYIGIDNEVNDYDYWFLYKEEKLDLPFLYLEEYGLDIDKIINDLNLETINNKYGEKCIKGCHFICSSKEYIEEYLKPLLKDDQTEENKQELVTTILQAVMNEDWAYMLTLFPEGVEYRGTCNTVDDFDDWDTYDTFARYTHPAQKMLKDKCLSKVLDLMSNK